MRRAIAVALATVAAGCLGGTARSGFPCGREVINSRARLLARLEERRIPERGRRRLRAARQAPRQPRRQRRTGRARRRQRRRPGLVARGWQDRVRDLHRSALAGRLRAGGGDPDAARAADARAGLGAGVVAGRDTAGVPSLGWRLRDALRRERRATHRRRSLPRLVTRRGVAGGREPRCRARASRRVEPADADDRRGRPPLLWSPDGTRIAFASFAGGEIEVVSLAGTLRRIALGRAATAPLAWSQDGTELLLAGGKLIGEDGRPVTRFPVGADVEAVSPDWTRSVLGESAGRFGYAGVDLYLADGRALAPVLISPRRCAAGYAQCVEGGDGPDTLVGTDRYDIVFGHGGDDRLYGKEGPNHLRRLRPRPARRRRRQRRDRGPARRGRALRPCGDRLPVRGPGDDVLVPGRGQDAVYGDEGDDRMLARDGWRDSISCGPGRDRVIADARDVVAADCEQVQRPPAGR